MLSGNKAKRIAAGVMGLTLLLVLLLAALFLIAEADHDCAGEDCPICAVMCSCAQALRRFGAAARSLSAAAAPAACFLFAAALCAPLLALETPVSRRSRLNN